MTDASFDPSYRALGFPEKPRFSQSPIAIIGALSAFASLLAVLILSGHRPLDVTAPYERRPFRS